MGDTQNTASKTAQQGKLEQFSTGSNAGEVPGAGDPAAPAQVQAPAQAPAQVQANETADDEGKANGRWPANTPVAEMTPDERANYWKFHSRKHEDEAKNLREQIEALQEQNAAPVNTDDEESGSIDSKVSAAVREAEERIRQDNATRLVNAELKAAAALAGVDISAHTEFLNVSKFIDPQSGDVDTEKIDGFIQSLPSGERKARGLPGDFGGHKPYSGATGLDVGREIYRNAHGRN